MQEDIIIKIRADIGKTRERIRNLQQSTRKQYTRIARAQQKLYEQTNKLNAALGRSPFKGWALSIMFAGMALQSMATSVWKFGVKAFDEISHSVEGTVTKNDMLQGSMKYLGFVIGDALQPVIGWLIPIIDAMAQWIEEHPTLTAFIVSTTAALGGLATVIGGTTLAVSAFKNAWAILKGLNIIGFLSNIPTLIKNIKFSPLVKEITKTIASIKNMRLTSLLSFVGIITGIILMIIWIFKLKNAIGGWGEFFKSVLRGVMRFVVMLSEFIITGLITPFQILIALLARAMRALGMNPPKWMYDFVNLKPNLIETYFAWEQENFAPKNGYMEYGGIVPKKIDDSITSQGGNTYYIDSINIQSNDLDQMNASINQVTGS